jgi:hypothetical protein
MEVSGQLHVPAALLPGKEPSISRTRSKTDKGHDIKARTEHYRAVWN